MNKELQHGEFLKLHWSDFHLSSLGGVVISFPVTPVDTISPWWVLSMMIQTVKVGVMTVLVPPGSFEGNSTVTALAVIVLIFGAKGVTTVTRKRITSSSWKQNTSIKAGVNVKAVFTSLNTAFLPISRSRFKRRQIPMLKTLSTIWQFCVNFWVIFRCFGKERFFLKG